LDDRAKQYRKNAADSLTLSEEAITRKSQTYWLTMAEFWFRLAQYVEETEAIGVIDPSAFADKTGLNVDH
jgi:hypothetical protein